MNRSALFSDCRRYRYALWRDLGLQASVCGDTCVFIGLNPSTADETVDDPTIRRCMRFARDWGFQRLCMLNLFALRAPDPRIMLAAVDPIGPDNDLAIEQNIRAARLVVAAWGVHGAHRGRADDIRASCGSRLHHLGLTKDGHPRHPLYLRADTRPVLMSHPHGHLL